MAISTILTKLQHFRPLIARFQMFRNLNVKIKESAEPGVVKIPLRAFFEPEGFMA